MTNSLRVAVSGALTMFGVALLAPVTRASEQRGPDTVVMIHGAGGGAWEYARWRKPFELAGWKVVARDLEPAGGNLASTEFSDYVRQVRAEIPVHHGKLVLIGASLGGILALTLAQDAHPFAVVLVNSVPPAGVGKVSNTKAYPPVIRWAHGSMKDTRDALRDSDEATIRWAYTKWRDESGAVLNEAMRGVAVRPPRVPTLVIVSSEDTDVPPATSLEVAKWARADARIYAHATHVGPLLGTRAREVAGDVVRWLSQR